MNSTSQIHHPRPATHLPAHERAARRHRATATLNVIRKPARPSHPAARTRRTVAAHFSNREVPRT